MGCICSTIGSFVSMILSSVERITACTLCAMVSCCLAFTILTVLMMGVGLGFHYCYVAQSIKNFSSAKTRLRADPIAVMKSVDRNFLHTGFAHRNIREADAPPLTNQRNITNSHPFRRNFNITITKYNLTKISHNFKTPTRNHSTDSINFLVS